jgi:hypothetical protein
MAICKHHLKIYTYLIPLLVYIYPDCSCNKLCCTILCFVGILPEWFVILILSIGVPQNSKFYVKINLFLQLSWPTVQPRFPPSGTPILITLVLLSTALHLGFFCFVLKTIEKQDLYFSRIIELFMDFLWNYAWRICGNTYACQMYYLCWCIHICMTLG